MKSILLIIMMLFAQGVMAQYVMKPTEHWLELRAHVTHFKDARTFRIADDRGIVHQLALGAVEPPERGQPYFKEALARVTELMKGKEIVIKHRYFDQKMGEFHEGAAFIAYRARVRVLPMAVVNAADYLHLFRRNIRLVIGEPFPVPEGKADREALASATAAYKERVAQLFETGAESVRAAGRPMYTTDKINK